MKQLDVQVLRLVWLVLPFAMSPVVGDATDGGGDALRIGTAIALWLVWAATMVALMVPRTETLTAIRIIVPAAFAVAIWAAIAAQDEASAVSVALALALSGIAAVFAWRAPVGDAFVDGSSYGDETRFLLRTPGALAIGPLFVLIGLLVVPAIVGPTLLLDGSPVVGVLLTLVALAVAWLAVPAVHRLSQRWLVFVPAGVVVHDRTALREPQLFRVDDVAGFGPAPADAIDEAVDLTLGGSGLVLRLQLAAEQKIMPNRRGASDSELELLPLHALLVAPNRPGAVLTEASERGFPIA